MHGSADLQPNAALGHVLDDVTGVGSDWASRSSLVTTRL